MQVIRCWRTFNNYFIIYSFNVSSQDFMRPRREKRKTTGMLMLVRSIVQPQDHTLPP